MDDPYQTPKVEIKPDEIESEVRLFTLKQVGWGTFFGNWIAGGILMACNSIGQKKIFLAATYSILGLLGFVAYMYLLYYFGRGYKLFINIGLALLFVGIANMTSGTAMRLASEKESRQLSSWWVFGAVLIGFMPIVLVIALVMFTNLAKV